jgi:hypothetical protein
MAHGVAEAWAAARIEDLAREVRRRDALFDARWPGGSDAVDPGLLHRFDEDLADLHADLADTALRLADELLP